MDEGFKHLKDTKAPSKEQDLKGEEDYRLAKEEKDEKKAFALFQRAADKGFAKAQVDLGKLLEWGKGVVQDEKKAFEWYLKAAVQNNVEALCYVARAYRCGSMGVPQNEKKGVAMYQSLALQNYPPAINGLAFAYDNGYGVERDVTKAFQLYLKSAQLGFDYGQFNVSQCYRLGSGTPVDHKQQFYWLQESTKGRNFWDNSDRDYRAQLMAECYENGTGTPVNFVEAIRWYGKALQQDMVRQLFDKHREEIASILITQHETILELQNTILELECKPGGPEFVKAKEEFEKLSVYQKTI